ncbi:19262_t:CDS:2 [Rhizophagus irregularis]|nr:19262_t:CDS:2 [Rhizophagus irregularis]
MPVQLSTILYISEYREKTPGEFFIGIAIRYTRLEEGQRCRQALVSDSVLFTNLDTI